MTRQSSIRQLYEILFAAISAGAKAGVVALREAGGAPLEDDEVLEIEKAYPVVK